MQHHEWAEVLEELYAAFPSVKRRLVESPRSGDAWKRALVPLAADLVFDGLARWLHTHNFDPTLEQFLQLLETLATERTLRQGRQPVAFTQAAPLGSDRVPVEEVRVLLAALFEQFDANTLRMEHERQARAGAVTGGRRRYRNGMLGPIPGWNPAVPLPGIPRMREDNHDDR